jgi:hypothetical protein
METRIGSRWKQGFRGWKQYVSTSILHSVNRLEVVKYTWKVGNELDWILGVNGGRRDGRSGRKWKEVEGSS